MMRFGCPGCKTFHQVSDEQTTRPISCPRCGQRMSLVADLVLNPPHLRRTTVASPVASEAILPITLPSAIPVSPAGQKAPTAIYQDALAAPLVATLVNPDPVEATIDPSRAAWLGEPRSWLDHVGFLFRLLFFAVTPIFVVVTCGLINENFLMVVILLTTVSCSFLGNPLGLLQKVDLLDKIPLVGNKIKPVMTNGLEHLKEIHGFYRENRPRNIVFYLFYPVTCLSSLPFSALARRELRLYGGIIATLAIILITESAASYSTTYPPYLGVAEAIGWGVARLLFSLAVLLCFFVPVATTTFSYHLTGKKWRLRSLVCVGLLAGLPGGLIYYYQSEAKICFLSSELLAQRFQSSTFREDLRETTEIFLLSQIKKAPAAADHGPHESPHLTKRFRSLIGQVAVRDEANGFTVFTLSGEGQYWIGVKVRFFDSLLHPPFLLGVVSANGEFCGSWQDLPDTVKRQFRIGGLSAYSPKLDELGMASMIDDLK
jgi:hypothetical protein